LEALMAWLEGSLLGQAMRESSVWTYGVVNLFHILGISTLFGSVLVLDLRLLGAWRAIPLSSITRATVPISKIGFSIAIISGICLITTNATEYVGNLFLLIKFPAIGAGILNVALLSRMRAWRERDQRTLTQQEERQLALFGGVSVICWLTAITAGRMIAYW